jgi:hypothetical protein
MYGDAASRGSNGYYIGGEWDDMWGWYQTILDSNIGYVVEYESVPEPSTLLLVASALNGFVGFRKKFRK